MPIRSRTESVSRSGAFSSSGPGQRGGTEPHTDPGRYQKEHLARELAAVLRQAVVQGRVERLVLVAAPGTLDDLRAAMPAIVADRVGSRLTRISCGSIRRIWRSSWRRIFSGRPDRKGSLTHGHRQGGHRRCRHDGHRNRHQSRRARPRRAAGGQQRRPAREGDRDGKAPFRPFGGEGPARRLPGRCSAGAAGDGAGPRPAALLSSRDRGRLRGLRPQGRDPGQAVADARARHAGRHQHELPARLRSRPPRGTARAVPGPALFQPRPGQPDRRGGAGRGDGGSRRSRRRSPSASRPARRRCVATTATALPSTASFAPTPTRRSAPSTRARARPPRSTWWPRRCWVLRPARSR